MTRRSTHHHQSGPPYYHHSHLHLHPLPNPHHSYSTYGPGPHSSQESHATAGTMDTSRSRGQSPADSNSESSANSPGDSSASTVGKRRTRASKPKVRTGCITCKIRRVKCGEEKPACLRCTSTGRKCDGYDSTLAPSRALSSMRAEESQRGVELARQEFLRAYQWNAAMRSLRPIVADIDGTEAERRFFHGFRAVASAGDQGAFGLTAHVSNSSSFWSRVAPQLAHRDGAVKHAMVALGSAYQLYQQSPDGSWSSSSNRTLTMASASNAGGSESQDLELFTIQQYNKSIALLQRHAASSSPESVQLTLVCCLAFICLETLRADPTAALNHLTNGIRILDSLPSETFDFLASDITEIAFRGRRPSPSSSSSQQQQSPHPPSSSASASTSSSASTTPNLSPQQQQQSDQEARDMRTIIRMFCRLECSASFFSSSMRPSLALRAYALRRFDDGSTSLPLISGFESLAEAHAHCCGHFRDVVARLYETSGHWADASFWADPYQRRQQQALRARSRRLRMLLDRFAAGPAGLPAARGDSNNTTEAYSFRVDMLHFLTTELFLAGMTGLPDDMDDVEMGALDDGSGQGHHHHHHMQLDLGGSFGGGGGFGGGGMNMGLGLGVVGMGMSSMGVAGMGMGTGLGMGTGMGMGGMNINIGGGGGGSGGSSGMVVGPSSTQSQALLSEILGVANAMAQTARKIRGQRSSPVVVIDSGSSGVGSSSSSGGAGIVSSSAAGGGGSGGASMAAPYSRGFTYDMGMVAPLYLVAISAEDPGVRQRALKALQESHSREGFWDGPSLQSLVRRVGAQIGRDRWPFQDVPRSLTGLGGIPDMWDTLLRLELEDAAEAL